MPSFQIGEPASDEMVALASSTRRLLNAVLRVDGPSGEEVDALRRDLDALCERVEAIGARGDRPRFSSEDRAADTRPYYFPGDIERPVHFAIPWTETRQEGHRRFGEVRFDLLHEGPPGVVHGGYVAHFFDSLFGQNVVENRLFGPTRELSLRYFRPTPHGRVLRFESLIEEVEEERRFRLRGSLHDGETRLVEAEALFQQPSPRPESP